MPSLNFIELILGFQIAAKSRTDCWKPSLLLIFVLGATNSLNLLDGLDGLCAGSYGHYNNCDAAFGDTSGDMGTLRI